MNLTIIGTTLILIGTGLTAWDSYVKNNTELKMRESFIPYINRRKLTIAKACADLRQSIYYASTYPKKHGIYPEEAFPDETELKMMLESINYMSLAPARTIPEQGFYWPEIIFEKMRKTTKAISELNEKSYLLSPDLLELIVKIENLNLIAKAEDKLIAHRKIINNHNLHVSLGKKPRYQGNLKGYHEDLVEYFKLIQEFENHFIQFSTVPNARKYL